jgi:acyl-CoA synthetase (NDP forming)
MVAEKGNSGKESQLAQAAGFAVCQPTAFPVMMGFMEKKPPSLDEVFSPRGVAVVGASSTGAGFATGVLVALKQAGFPAIYPVNPKYKEVMGWPCYPNIRDIPGIVDHVIVSIPAESALALLDDCAAKGVRSVHFFTAGFSESGEAKQAELEQAMLKKAREGGFRIIGPNCIGLFVPKSRLVNTAEGSMEPGPVAFISQSGGHANNMPVYSSPRGLRFSKIVSYGNGLDVDESELLEYLGRDPETEIIAAYIEGVKDGQRFHAALERAAARKPVVIYKGGTTEAGQRAAYGHTASLTNSITVFNTLCHQMGTIQADDIDELIDVLVALRFVKPLPRNTGVAVIGGGGGPSVQASDEMEKAGLYMPNLSSEVRDELKQVLRVVGSILANPIDASNLTNPETIKATMRIVSRLPDINMLIYHLGFHPIGSWGGGRFSSPSFFKPAINGMKEVQKESGKPVLMVMRPGLNLEDMKEFLATQEAFTNAGFPVFYSLGQAARAMSRVIAWNRRHEAILPPPPH